MPFANPNSEHLLGTTDAKQEGKTSPTSSTEYLRNKENSLKFDRALRSIARGELAPEKAWDRIRFELLENDSFGEKVADALFQLSFNQSISTSNIDDARKWYQITWKVAAYLEDKLPKQAGRLQAIGDIIRAKVSAAENAVTAEDALKRKYVSEVLGIIARNEGTAYRKDIADILGLKTSNMSRILQRMQDAGLVLREKHGQEAIFKITEVGSLHAKPLSEYNNAHSDKLLREFMANLPDMVPNLSDADNHLDILEVLFDAMQDALQKIKSNFRGKAAEIAWAGLHLALKARARYIAQTQHIDDLPWIMITDLIAVASMKRNSRKKATLRKGQEIGPYIQIDKIDEGTCTIKIARTEELLEKIYNREIAHLEEMQGDTAKDKSSKLALQALKHPEPPELQIPEFDVRYQEMDPLPISAEYPISGYEMRFEAQENESDTDIEESPAMDENLSNIAKKKAQHDRTLAVA
jgi:DNA-binding MarR family transcriptional regulator